MTNPNLATTTHPIHAWLHQLVSSLTTLPPVLGLIIVALLLLVLLVLNHRKKLIIANKSKVLAETEARYSLLFEHSPIPLLEEDLSAIKTFLDQLHAQGITDLAGYFDQHPESLYRCIDLARICTANRAALRLYGARRIEDLCHVNTILPEDQTPSFQRAILTLLRDGSTELVHENRSLDGRLLTVERRMVVAAGP